MMPVLFTIGEFNVYSFGFFLTLAFLLSTFVLWKKAKEELKEEEYLDIYLYTSLVALIGGRVTYVLFHNEEFGLNILRYIVVREAPGLSLLGGVLWGGVFLFLYSFKKKNFWHLSDLFALSFGFALSFAKIGEFLGGGNFGKETNFFLAAKVIGKMGRFHPVELYEAFLFLIIAVVLYFLSKKISRRKYSEGLVSFLYIEILGVIFFLLEFFKSSQVYLYGLSIRQIFILLTMCIVLIPLVKKVKILRTETI
jgi:phosphatidylglycerol:prolipoprotein diacylglycerol transferase